MIRLNLLHAVTYRIAQFHISDLFSNDIQCANQETPAATMVAS